MGVNNRKQNNKKIIAESGARASRENSRSRNNVAVTSTTTTTTHDHTSFATPVFRASQLSTTTAVVPGSRSGNRRRRPTDNDRIRCTRCTGSLFTVLYCARGTGSLLTVVYCTPVTVILLLFVLSLSGYLGFDQNARAPLRMLPRSRTHVIPHGATRGWRRHDGGSGRLNR